MLRTARTHRRLLAALAVLAALAAGLGGEAIAQNPPPRRDGFDDLEVDAAEPMMFNQPVFNVADTQFDNWVFGNARTSSAARIKLESLLSLQVDEADRTCKLNLEQKTKLTLAGQGDLKRYFDRVEDSRKAFQLVRHDQQKFQAFYSQLGPLQAVVQVGAFGDNSLFQKVLKRSLNPEQEALIQKAAADRKLFRYRAKIDLAVAMLDNSAGLNGDQRKALINLLKNETRPPKKFGAYDFQVIMFQLSKLPEAKVKTIFNDNQWRLVVQQFDNARRLEAFLKTNGFLPDEPAKLGNADPK